MAEYSNAAQQTVQPGQSVIFTVATIPCNRGLVRWRAGSGAFSLKGWVPNNCCCAPKSANYLVDFGANIAVPTGQTVGQISLAYAIDGVVLQDSVMQSTPAAVEEFNNVSRAISVPVWKGCCQTLTVTNTSTIPILLQNANIIFSRPDLAVTY